MGELTKDAVLRTVHTFVLRAGRMTDAQRKAYETLSPRWCIPFNEFPLNYIDVFDNLNPVTIEIGFGMGKATAIIAQNNPEKNSKLKYLIYLTCGIFILALVYLILTSFIIVPLGFNIEDQINTSSLNSLSAKYFNFNSFGVPFNPSVWKGETTGSASSQILP